MIENEFPCPVPTKPPIARFHCRHYDYVRGMQKGLGPHCAIGLNLSAPAASLPCMPVDPKRKDIIPCPKRGDWTEEERATWIVWQTAHMRRFAHVIASIPHESYEGSSPCPGCGTGTLRWTRARSNGHLHAGCTTPDCFSVVQ